jgi:CubicO group peptidase (beta-lactamase class C family)
MIYTHYLKLLTSLVIFWFANNANQQACAQDARARLDTLFTTGYATGRINGQVLIAQNGSVIYERSFGLADRQHKIPVSSISHFNLASVSKLFTAVAVLQLKEKGTLKLTDPVVKYLPEFPFPNVTIRHLLTHTSGLADFDLFDEYYDKDSTKVLTNAYVMPAIKHRGKLLFEPGDKWSYSSFGMALLAAIVEKVTGLKFEQYLKKYIWEPSGMQSTYINSLSAPVADPSQVKIYARASLFSDSLRSNESIPGNRKFAWVSGALLGPGLVISDDHDLLRFDQALYAGKLLKQATMDEAFTPIKLNNGEYARPEPFLGKTGFGLGWFLLLEDPARKIVLHTGKQGGLVTIFVRDITRKQTFILLDNAGSEGLNNLTINAIRILDDKPILVLKKSLAFTYARDVANRGIDFAVSHFNQIRSDTVNHYFHLFEFVYVGYQLITLKKQEGMETLRLLTQINPDNWFPYFSYGKALFESGFKEEATMNLNKSLSLSPGNKEVMSVLEQMKVSR